MSFRLVPKSVTFNYLERRNGPYFALFYRIRVRCHRIKQLLGLYLRFKIYFDKSVIILIRSARLFSDYLGKTRRGNSLDFRL